ncbi:hypothetical protein ACP275_06G127700 [Erythranthe tilingii]
MKISLVFNVSDLYSYHGDELESTIAVDEVSSLSDNSVQESIDVLDMRTITTRRGSYTQYLVHWNGKPSSEDSWISGEELKSINPSLWFDLHSNSRASSFQPGENDAAEGSS